MVVMSLIYTQNSEKQLLILLHLIKFASAPSASIYTTSTSLSHTLSLEPHYRKYKFNSVLFDFLPDPELKYLSNLNLRRYRYLHLKQIWDISQTFAVARNKFKTEACDIS